MMAPTMYLAHFIEEQRGDDYWARQSASLVSQPKEFLRSVYSFSPIHQFAYGFFPKTGKTLDAGCGFGALALNNPHPENQIFGIDAAPFLIETARQLTPQVRYQVATLNQLPFPDRFFDLYVAISSLELIPEGIDPALREAFRVLKPGGRIVVVSPALPVDFFLSGGREVELTVGRFRVEKIASVPDVFPKDGYGYFYTRGEWQRALRGQGFNQVKGQRRDLVGGITYSPFWNGILRKPGSGKPLNGWIQKRIKRLLEGDPSWAESFYRQVFLRETGVYHNLLWPCTALFRRLWGHWHALSGRRPW